MADHKYSRFRLRRYHYEIYLPENISEMLLEFVTTIKSIGLGDTNHSIDESKNDKRKYIPTPTIEQLFDQNNIFVECYELLDNRGMRRNILQKCVIRATSMSDEVDYTYVVAREGSIVTNWANDKNDKHRLKHSNVYYKPVPKEKLRGNINQQVN